jgi:hypothetical protein
MQTHGQQSDLVSLPFQNEEIRLEYPLKFEGKTVTFQFQYFYSLYFYFVSESAEDKFLLDIFQPFKAKWVLYAQLALILNTSLFCLYGKFMFDTIACRAAG